jgi:hypothetical protein
VDRRGATARPEAIRAVITASCRGEASTSPWPIPALSVSPIRQAASRTRRFQARSGTSPPVIGTGRS